ncbi:hypothetical protein GCM10011494_02900 [Novosphingobium endophyticum]|uniref:Uncharacterized protein n=1 Tax=Novosphingobium endophyticum TaxID=1955250 RepID=A0A916TPB1_9SPHN|nr:hypothetical protein [Novosphingobium endophyticum]GGB87976.1 hypothetical protein GCM10011494_02900 [Novosphingobium endophyticum]
MNKSRRVVFSAIIAATIGLLPASAFAQSATPEEVWQSGVRYLKVTNTSGMNTPATKLYCSILAADGSWASLYLTPGQYIYKAIHPAMAAQWNCTPVPW